MNLFSLIKHASAQNKEHIFNNYSVNDGLSHNWVRAITQDKDGFMWIGTADGLNRFDGYSFEIFKDDEDNPLAIKSNVIEALYTDAEGKVWIGYDGGFSTYDNTMGYFNNYVHDPQKNSFVGGAVHEIVGDKNDNIWIATFNYGISILNKKTGRFTNLQNDPKDPASLISNSYVSISLDKNDNAWIGTQNGVDFYNAKTKKITHYGKGSNSIINQILSIKKIYVDSKGKVWIITWGKGLVIYDPLSNTVKKLENISDNYDFIDLIEHPNGDMWLSAENSGIIVYNSDKKSTFNISHNSFGKYSLPHNSVYDIYLDNSKNLWLGTFAGGLSHYLSQNNPFGYYFNIPDNPKSLTNNSVLCFENHKEILFIGTDGGGLNTLNLNTGEFNRINSTLPGVKLDIIITMFKVDDKFLWMVSYKEGIFRYNILTGQLEDFTNVFNLNEIVRNSVSSILIDRKQNIWMATWGSGLHHFDFKKNKLTSFVNTSDTNSISTGVVFHITEDSKGKIWASTGNGLNLLEDFEKGKFIKYVSGSSKRKNSSKDAIQMSFEDSRGWIWVCTSEGLICFDLVNKKAKSYSTKDGLPNNFINAVTEDKNGNLWISTNGGLSYFDLKKQTFKNYNHLDGLQGNLYNRKSVCNITTRNLIAFGGSDGFNLFNPAHINLNYNIPEINFTGLWVQDQKITPLANKDILTQDISHASEVELDYDVDKIKVDFVGVNFIDAYKNQYAYYLEGFDKSWSYTDKMSVTYTNLDPGKYLLHLKVSTDGTWNKKVKTLIINIRYPYWQKWWFILIEVLFFGSLWFLSLYAKSINSYKFISGVLTIFTLVATLELITTTVDSMVDIRGGNPVYTFLVNLTIAIVLMPLEGLLKKFIKEEDANDANKAVEKKPERTTLLSKEK